MSHLYAMTSIVRIYVENWIVKGRERERKKLEKPSNKMMWQNRQQILMRNFNAGYIFSISFLNCMCRRYVCIWNWCVAHILFEAILPHNFLVLSHTCANCNCICSTNKLSKVLFPVEMLQFMCLCLPSYARIPCQMWKR